MKNKCLITGCGGFIGESLDNLVRPLGDLNAADY